MPRVDPETHVPLTDDPGGPDDERGGKHIGDPALAGASEQGRGVKKFKEINDDGLLLGEKPAKQ